MINDYSEVAATWAPSLKKFEDLLGFLNTAQVNPNRLTEKAFYLLWLAVKGFFQFSAIAQIKY